MPDRVTSNLSRYLVRPNSRVISYGVLDDLAAVEPPHWMGARAEQVLQGASAATAWMVDLQTDPGNIEFLRGLQENAVVEIWPTGNHPSAHVQEQAGIVEVQRAIGSRGELVTQLPAGVTRYSPTGHYNPSHYRAHNWHAWGTPWPRSPYATVHTSASCPHVCAFCSVRDYYGTVWSERAIKEVLHDLDSLSAAGTHHVKIMDELFVRRTPRFKELIHAMAGYGDTLNFWGYARVDSVDPALLPDMKSAGINWVCLGIESGDPDIRASMHKGTFTNRQVRDVVCALQDAGIAVLGNFLFGFPDDTADTMERTYQFAVELDCEYANFYAMVAYPGTELEKLARATNWALPTGPSQYAQYSRDFLPLPTHALSATEVLRFRDRAWHEYHSRASYLELVRRRFGPRAVEDMIGATDRDLPRDLFGGGNWKDVDLVRTSRYRHKTKAVTVRSGARGSICQS